jgi:hypothetical protein
MARPPAVIARLGLALVLLVSPASLQARYDAARDVVEHSHDANAIAAARAEIAATERSDHRPFGVRAPTIALPSTWLRARAPSACDAQLSIRLRRVGHAFDGTAAFWIHDLADGRIAAWNAETRLPAASTVKLAALAAALHSDRRDLRYDEQQLAAWSSNLAANRIVELLGYARIDAALRALGMRHSTYPGPYRAGTGLGGASTRVTTAHDLGRALFALQRAAAGRSSFLTAAQGRRALDLLRGSIPAGDNQGLLRPWLHGVAVAEKNGWISDARLTAAIIYRGRGPLIVVVAAYRPELRRFEARALGEAVLRALAPRLRTPSLSCRACLNRTARSPAST